MPSQVARITDRSSGRGCELAPPIGSRASNRGCQLGVNLRPATSADTEACGLIMHSVFTRIAQRRGFPPDLPTLEAALQLANFLISHPSILGVVAERPGRIVG